MLLTLLLALVLPIDVKFALGQQHAALPGPTPENYLLALLLFTSWLCLRRRFTWSMNACGDVGGVSERSLSICFESRCCRRWNSLRYSIGFLFVAQVSMFITGSTLGHPTRLPKPALPPVICF